MIEIKRRSLMIAGALFLLSFAATYWVAEKRPRVLFFTFTGKASDAYTHFMSVPVPCLIRKVEMMQAEVAGENRIALWVSCQ